jgi:hypothetical protein
MEEARDRRGYIFETLRDLASKYANFDGSADELESLVHGENDVPGLDRHNEAALSFVNHSGATELISKLKRQRDSLDALCSALCDTRKQEMLSFPERREDRILGWHDMSVVIANMLRTALRSTNPKAALGNSNDGPVPRFVTVVLPMITNDTPTVANVGKWLKDNARATRDKPEE